MTHFIRLARRGNSPTASGGEARAFILARAVAENVGGLDDAAFEGFIAFARLARVKPTTAEDVLEGRKEP